MGDLAVVRLLQNPLGQEAPAGHRGDIVRVSDGQSSLYLFPWEFDAVDEAQLRWLLAQGSPWFESSRRSFVSAQAPDAPSGS